MRGCPSCGLFISHVPGCRGVIAVYYRYHQKYQKYEEDGFHSVDEAVQFLGYGEDAGSLSSHSIELGDGTVLMEQNAIWKQQGEALAASLRATNG